MERSFILSGLFLILGIPLLTVVLGEVGERLKQRKEPLGDFFHQARNYLLPTLAVLLAIQMLSSLVAFNYANIAKSIAETGFWLAVVYVVVFRKFAPRIHIPTLVFQVARILAIVVIGGYVFTDIWKLKLTDLITVVGIGTAIAALALQETFSSLVSGFLLILERPLRRGDWIRVGDIEGEIIEINWRAVRLISGGSVVIIPNVVLFKDIIHNYTLLSQLYVDSISLCFDYEQPPNRIRRILKSAALQLKEIVEQPPPEVITKSYEDNAICYELKFCINDFKEKNKIHNQLMTRIYYTAKRNQLKIKGQSYKREISPEEIMDFFSSLPFFMSIEKERIDKLSRKAIPEYYGVGEQVITIGEPDRGFYLIYDGVLQLTVMDIHNQQREVSKLKRGDFLGEMALLLGEPSLVSGIVIEDLEVIFIDHVSINKLLEESTQFARVMNQFIDNRKMKIDLTKGKE